VQTWPIARARITPSTRTDKDFYPTGNMWVAGADARLDFGAFGSLTPVFALGAKQALVVARALEVVRTTLDEAVVGCGPSGTTN